MVPAFPTFIADWVHTAGESPPPPSEGVPWWASLFLLPIVGVGVEYLRRRLKLDRAATEPTKPTPPEPAAPKTDPDTPRERYDQQMALIAKMVEDQDSRLQRVDRELDEERDRNQRLTMEVADLRAENGRLKTTIDRLLTQPPQGPVSGPPPPP